MKDQGLHVITLLAILNATLLVGCGGSAPVTAHARVVVRGLTTRANAVDIILAPGIYDFMASGIADANSAEITLTVLDRDAAEIATAQLSLPLAEANASPGDSGAGLNTGVMVVEGVQSVPIDFRWLGGTPTADVGVDLHFYDNPDIVSLTTDPQPPVRPATRVDVQVQATNNEGSQNKLTVDSQFVDASAGSVINTVALSLDVDGLFKGQIAAPGYPGAHSLRIVVVDNSGGVTQHDILYAVQ